MGKYVFSYRVPVDYAPAADITAQWQEWFGTLGSSLVDIGHAVTEYTSRGTVGASPSRMIGYSLVSANDLDSAVDLAAGCPVLRVGGGVEIGPVGTAADL